MKILHEKAFLESFLGVGPHSGTLYTMRNEIACPTLVLRHHKAVQNATVQAMSSNTTVEILYRVVCCYPFLYDPYSHLYAYTNVQYVCTNHIIGETYNNYVQRNSSIQFAAVKHTHIITMITCGHFKRVFRANLN